MNNRKQCKGCKYYGYVFPDIKGCNYCLVTDKLRGCSVEECDKKVLGRYTRKPFYM